MYIYITNFAPNAPSDYRNKKILVIFMITCYFIF